MSFDYKLYSDAMDTFLLRMEQIHSHKDPDIGIAMGGLCDLLRISRVEAYLYESEYAFKQGQGKMVCFYQKGCTDTNRVISHSELVDNGSVAVYQFAPFEGEPDWDLIETDKIKILAKVLYVYNGRSRIMKMVSELAYKDTGLGIYNLQYFMKMCGAYIELGEASKYGAAYMNLRRFANINQHLGREDATEAMRVFVSNLQQLTGENGLVCRIGGDNFAVLFQRERFESVRDYLKGQAIVCGENKVFISATVGYYLISENIQEPSEIMDNISIAFNQAKGVTKEPFVVHTEELTERILEGKYLEEIFPEALEKGEFTAFYQPKVALKNYSLAGAEALCRWIHDGQMIMPNRFIPVFERTKAITNLDFYMLEQVCRDIRRWLDEGKKVVTVSINFSRRHLGDMNLLERILEIVDRYRVPHEYIEIELTETTTDVDFKDLREIVTGLQRAGIKTSVDDFGMGYSSLNLIKELPWDVLKIDKSLLEPIATGEKNGSIMLTHVISMAQEMGLECIVEGVETAKQVQFLKQHNCYLAQGFFFDKPLPKAEFEQRLNEIQE